ncbi:MAG TPA: nucleotidyltransferase domain-containing protein [Acidothermaceae bacterium]
MDLSSPLRSLIPSLDSAVLEVLAGTESSLSQARITDLAARGSRQGIATVLQRLVEHGLVLAQPANQGALYRLNREHVLAHCVTSAADARSEITRRLRAAATRLRPAPTATALFGSFVRRQTNVDSDIDLLIVVANDVDVASTEWSDQIESLVKDTTLWTGNRLEPLVLTENAVAAAAAADEPLIDSLRAEAVPLTGHESLTHLLDRPARPRGRRTAVGTRTMATACLA